MHNDEIESNQDKQDPGQEKVYKKDKQESVDRDQPTQERLKALDM